MESVVLKEEPGLKQPQFGGNRVWMLFLLLSIYITHVMDRQIMSVLAEPIRKDLALTDTQLGLITGLVFALFYGVCSVPVAWLADRFGRIKIIVMACTLWSLCSAAGGLATSFGQLALARMGVAVGEAGGPAQSHSLIAERFSAKSRATVLGIFALGLPLGGFFGVVLCGWIAANFGWRTAVISVSLPGLIFAALLLFTVPESRGGAGDADAPSFVDGIAAFLKSRLLRSVALAAAFSAVTATGISMWLPAYLIRVKGMTLTDLATYYSASSAIAIAAGIYTGGALSDKLASRWPQSYAMVPAISFLIAAPMLVAAVMAGSWQLSMTLFMVPLFLLGTFVAPSTALVQHEATPYQRGIFASLLMLGINLIGSGIGPLLVGAVSDFARPTYGDRGLAAGILAIAPVMLLVAFLFFRVSLILKARSRAEVA
ncbi:MAG TPA: MFS transporter [Sphingobium sp.]|nr:MFS transporter [Sphingobium sp.]